ncbi:hypothetical protein [Aeromicrobium sp. CTD01-1L150]|uniref:hypothetical protein n=1 Tax=Aeromicrobium sp. CTD01-1L150 TaxID=3341830 RepID=UPI0035BF2091
MSRQKAATKRRTAVAPTLVLTVGAVACPVLAYFALPGFTALWLALLVAAWMLPAPELTGKKDASGYPTAATERERSQLARYQGASELKWRLLVPNGWWGPGWSLHDVAEAWREARGRADQLPIYVSARIVGVAVGARLIGDILAAFIVGLVSAAAVFSAGHLESAITWADAAAVYVLGTTLAGWRRMSVSAGDLSPGIRVDSLPGIGRNGLVALAAGAAAGATAGVSTLSLVNERGGHSSVWVAACLTLGAAVAVSPWWRTAALSDWYSLLAARREWMPRWEALKIEPPPLLVDRRQLGATEILTFDAPSSKGASLFYPMAAKLSPAVGAGTTLVVLSSPNTDSSRAPVPGSRHPVRFRVVTWPSDETPDLTDPETDQDVVTVLTDCVLAQVADELGAARPMVETATALAASETGRQAWAMRLLFPDGPTLKYVRTTMRPLIAAQLNTEVLVDDRGGLFFVGDLTSGETDLDSGGVTTVQTMRDVANEDTWNLRWEQVLKQGVNPPRPDHSVAASEALPDGVVVHRQPFVVKQGFDPEDYFDHGPKLKTTLKAAPFVAVTGFPASGRGTARPGERHAQAFTVCWADRPVPADPDRMSPSRGDGAVHAAQRWVLAGYVADAFKTARLARPELYAARPLTVPESRGHIWEMKVRLYGGVTLANVRGAAGKLKEGLGATWLRVGECDDGAVIIAGADPTGVTFADPERDVVQVESLDWEQAWLDARVTGVGGLTPSLLEVSTLPKNDKVRVFDFSLPSGLAFSEVKAATRKLETSTGNAYVEVRRHSSGRSDRINVMVSETNPMPELAPFDFDAAETGDHRIPLGVGVAGEPVAYDNKTDPMLFVFGMPGSGKSESLKALTYGALRRDWIGYIVEPVKGATDFAFAEPWCRAVAVDLWQAKAVLDDVYSLVMERKSINKAHACGNYRDLPDDVRYPHVLVLLDEFTSLMLPDPPPAASDDPQVQAEIARVHASNAAKAYIGTYIGKIVREARSTGFTLVLATQSLKAKTLDKIPGGNDLKDNMSRAILGRASSGQLMSSLKMPEEVPPMPEVLPPGRGLYEGNGKRSESVQFWFEGDQAVFARELAARREPLKTEDKLDLSGAVEPTPEVHDGMLLTGPEDSAAIESDEPVVVDLGTLDLSLEDLESDDDPFDDQTPDTATRTELSNRQVTASARTGPMAAYAPGAGRARVPVPAGPDPSDAEEEDDDDPFA